MPRKKAAEEGAGVEFSTNIIAEEGIDQYDLPRAAILKLARQKLPDNAIIRKDAHTALIKACPVFINYIVAMAHELAANNKGGARKKVNANDILEAVEQLELPKAMSKELSKQLDAYRTIKADGPKRKQPKSQAIAPEPSAGVHTTVELIDGEEVGEEDEEDDEEEGDAEETPTDDEDEDGHVDVISAIDHTMED